MAATVQLNIQTNEAQVRAQLQSIQQQLMQMSSRTYNIQLNLQANSALTQQLNDITRLLRNIRDNQNLHIQIAVDNGNNTVNTLNQIDNSLRNLNTTTNNINGSYNTLNQTVNNYNRQQRQNLVQNNILIGALRTLGHVLVHEVRAAFNSALTEMKAVDTELITIQKVTGDTAEGMKRYADDAYEVAARLGAGASEYLNAVAEFAKAGYKDKSKELGELAITAAKVGDTTQSMANQFLLSVDAAYKYQGSIEKLTAVLDGANEIGNRFPTSVEKIAQGLGKVSPIAAQAHVGIDELTAAIGTITAVTQRSGTEAATALRALYLNIIGDTKTEIEDGAKWTAGEIEGLRDLLRKYAGDLVEAADKTGQVINPMEAVRALYLAMQEGVLTEQELMQQVSDIGGKLRSSQLLALIQNFDKYEQMLETYRDSAGSAAEEYSIYLNSWEAKTKQLSATWTDFVQNRLGTDKIKDLLDKLIKIVENLDNWIPLIQGIGLAIVALGLPRLIQHIRTLITGINGVSGAISILLIAVGALASIWQQQADNARKAADESLKNVKKQQTEVNKMLELAATYESAAKNSDEFKKASEEMRKALEKEGEAVDNLSEKYRQEMMLKAAANIEDAKRTVTEQEAAVLSSYYFGGSVNSNAKVSSNRFGRSFFGKRIAGFDEAEKYLRESGAVSLGFNASDEEWFEASVRTPEGILAYAEAIKHAKGILTDAATAYRTAGQDAEANAILQSRTYQELGSAYAFLEETTSGYTDAIDAAKEAELTLSGITEFYNKWDAIKGGMLAKDQLEAYIKDIKESNELTETQKELLLSMAARVYPQYAEALGLVTKAYGEQAEAAEKAKSALEKYQEATKKGSEKDDPFKDYKGVYDTVIKEGKAGRYGSNAFQYGIQALLDPSIIKQYEGNWDGLVSYMQRSLGGLYKSADSMGTGLLDAIWKAGDKTEKNISKIKDETGEVLASFDKKTGDWYISDKPEDIKKLATKLGMSAESLVAAGIALGAIDPNAETGGLKDALDILLGRKTEEDPTVTAMNASAEAQNTAASAQDAAAQAQKDAAAAEEKAAEALLAAAGKSGNGASNQSGGATQGEAQASREAAIAAARSSNVAPETVTFKIASGNGTTKTMSPEATNAVYSMMNGVKIGPSPQARAQSSREAAINAGRQYNIALGTVGTATMYPSADILSGDRVGEYLATRNPNIRIVSDGHGGAAISFDMSGKTVIADAKGLVPDSLIADMNKGSGSSIRTMDYHSAASFFPTISPTVTGSGSAQTPSGTNPYFSSFNGTGQFVTPSVTGSGTPQTGPSTGEYFKGFNGTGQFVDAVAEGVAEGVAQAESGTGSRPAGTPRHRGRPLTDEGSASTEEPVPVEVVSNKDSSAYHNGDRGGLSVDQLPSGNLLLDALGMLFGGGSGSGAKVSVDTTEAKEALTETNDALDEIDNKEVEAEASVDPSGAVEGANVAKAAIDSIPESKWVSVNINLTYHNGVGGGGPHMPWTTETKAAGDENFHGGLVLVNEQAGGWNPELIVANGRAFIANGGDPAVLDLPRGARIFNADETRDIFNGGEDLLNVPAFAKGNAKDYYRKNKKKSSGSSGSGGSSSSSDGSTEFTDDMMKKLEQYMGEILDAAEDALNDQLEAINAQIYALKYQTEAAEKATALEEARLQLLEAEKNLLDANTERTVRYYNAATGQWEWMADQRKVMQAQEELYDAQKNLLEAEYDALATAWNELKDEITKALENNEPIDINTILAALGKSAASGSLPGLKSLISDIFTYTEDPRAVANFDGGGLASGLGWMPKGTRGTEAVLDSALTKMVLNPQTNAAFTGFTDSLATLFQLAGGNGGLPSSRFTGNVSNLYGGNTYIEGVRIGSDMMNRPLSEVLSTLNLYKNN